MTPAVATSPYADATRATGAPTIAIESFRGPILTRQSTIPVPNHQTNNAKRTGSANCDMNLPCRLEADVLGQRISLCRQQIKPRKRERRRSHQQKALCLVRNAALGLSRSHLLAKYAQAVKSGVESGIVDV